MAMAAGDKLGRTKSSRRLSRYLAYFVQFVGHSDVEGCETGYRKVGRQRPVWWGQSTITTLQSQSTQVIFPPGICVMKASSRSIGS